MRVPFQQGIITYPISGNLQSFLVSSGIYVTLSADNGRTDITFAHGDSNYLLSETSTVPDAWGQLPINTNCWLYWNIDKRTAIRTFGFTTVQPTVSSTTPANPVEDMHWFNTTTKIMYVYTSGAFREVIRVFAAKFNNSTFTPMGSNFPQRPFAGSQVGLTTSDVSAGLILIDVTGKPVRKTNGQFFTTEDDFYVGGSPVTILRLESTVLTGTAQQALHAYQVVVFSQFGIISPATYNIIQEGAVAILLEDLTTNDTGTVCLQGHITNPDWNWITVGAPLWVDDMGTLTETDPHVSSPLSYPVGKSPVARVITQNSIMFDQGLGGKGEPGTGGGADIGVASSVNAGIVKLSLDPVDTETPIAVGDNDPRMTDARTPLTHNQAATTIIPAPYGSLTGANLQLVLQQVEDSKLSKTGGTMTGTLTLSGAPTTALQAATKSYVDTTISSRVLRSGDTMTGALILNANPSNNLGAATKQYVDARVLRSGDTMTGELNMGDQAIIGLPATQNTNPTAATSKSYVDSLVTSGTIWVDPIQTPDIVGIVSSFPGSPINSGGYIAYGGTYPQTWGSITDVIEYDIIHLSGGVWYRVLTAAQFNSATITRVGVGIRTLSIDASLTGPDLVQYDLAEYVGGVGANPLLPSNWNFPHGRAGGKTFAVTSATMGTNTFLFTGVDLTSSFHTGNSFLYTGGTPGTEDGTYTIQSVSFGSGNTSVVVNEILGATTSGGTAEPEIKNGLTTLDNNPTDQHVGVTEIYNASANDWTEIAGPSAVNAGTGLDYSGSILNVKLGAGITELPSDSVGIDLYDSISGALILTTDGTLSSTVSSAGLYLKLDGSSLTQSSDGLKVGTITIPYDVAFYVPDNPFSPSATVSGFLVPRDMYIDTTLPESSIAQCVVAPTDVAGSTFEVYINSTLMATIVFAQGSNTGVVTWEDISFALVRGDVLTLRTIATLDPDIAGIGVTITGCAEAAPCATS